MVEGPVEYLVCHFFLLRREFAPIPEVTDRMENAERLARFLMELGDGKPYEHLMEPRVSTGGLSGLPASPFMVRFAAGSTLTSRAFCLNVRP